MAAVKVKSCSEGVFCLSNVTCCGAFGTEDQVHQTFGVAGDVITDGKAGAGPMVNKPCCGEEVFEADHALFLLTLPAAWGVGGRWFR